MFVNANINNSQKMRFLKGEDAEGFVLMIRRSNLLLNWSKYNFTNYLPATSAREGDLNTVKELLELGAGIPEENFITIIYIKNF